LTETPYSECFDDFFSGQALFYRRIRVDGDATITSQTHGNGKSFQFPGFRSEVVRSAVLRTV
jgi:hypothetical protein